MTADIARPLAGMPGDADGPIFGEPWQAHAFALAVALHRQGLFSWNEWARDLAAQISLAQAAGDADLGDTYYQHWLAALERLVVAKGATTPVELEQFADAWSHAAARTPHGQPIELQERDFLG